MKTKPNPFVGRPSPGTARTRNPIRRWLGLLAVAAAVPSLFGAADLYIRDTPSDTGLEPNPDTGRMYVSPDIWVRRDADPNYRPDPFPTASPTWMPRPHENPVYQDPRLSVPNYVYVRVHNRGDEPSTGTERLRVYWAKASTGLNWPAQWVDYMADTCGPRIAYGGEITKPRKNAATATAAERAAYVAALQRIDSETLFRFGDRVSYWDKQDQVHSNGADHGNLAFLPWHRELINRFEMLLRQADPTVTLLYWDWTTNPANSTGGFNFFTSSFMGNSGRLGGTRVGAPFATLDANGMCSSSRRGWIYGSSTFCSSPNNWEFPPPNLYRFGLNFPPFPAMRVDPTTRSSYSDMSDTLERNPHDNSHGYIGGSGDTAGNMSFLSASAEDPFFFLLHSNADRLWAMWQRQNGRHDRYDPNRAYGTSGSAPVLTRPLRPWDGSMGVYPYDSAGGHSVAKSARDPSLVFPPIYDTAPLTIPALAPGQSAIIQIPWYPPNRDEYACFGDPGHFCLLVRIETRTTSPFGMRFAEGANVHNNTRNNNNIAWKNIAVEGFPGRTARSGMWIRNGFDDAVIMRLRFQALLDANQPGFENFGTASIRLQPELFKLWQENGGAGQGFQLGGNNQLFLFSPDAFIEGIPLKPGQTFFVETQLELFEQYGNPAGEVYCWDVIQYGEPNDPDAEVGGVRVCADFNKLRLVEAGSDWNYLDDGSDPGPNWNREGYDDSAWLAGPGELGYGDQPRKLLSIPNASVTTYFRRTFNVDNPDHLQNLVLRLKRDDGAVVYLNGTEIHRVNMLTGTVDRASLATTDVRGVAEEVYFPVDLKAAISLLNAGPNLLAVEIHQFALNSEDLSFDLELCANVAQENHPPAVALLRPAQGQLVQSGQNITLGADALDVDGTIARVQFYADGNLIGEVASPPYTLDYVASQPGSVRFHVVATDNGRPVRSTTSDIIRVQVIDNLIPEVDFELPGGMIHIGQGTPLTRAVLANDPHGAVTQVQFFARNMENWFFEDWRHVGTDDTPPYTFSLDNTEPGNFMVRAVATDNQGATGEAAPIHVMVMEGLKITHHQGIVKVTWPDGPDSVLETAADARGPWTALLGASSPYTTPALTPQRFFRVRPQQEGDVSLSGNEVAVVGFQGATADDMMILAQNYGLHLIEALPDDTFRFGLNQPTDQEGLLQLAEQLRTQEPNLVLQAGLLASPNGGDQPLILTDELIVQFVEGTQPGEVAALNNIHGADIVFENPYHPNHYLLSVAKGSALNALELSQRYAQSPGVEYAEPNYRVFTDYRETFPNDPLFNNQWHLHNTGQNGGTVDADIDAPKAWDFTTGSAALTIAVIDNGFDTAHPDLIPNLWFNPGETPGNRVDDDGNGLVDDINGWDFAGNDNVLTNDNITSPLVSHGTSAAGCAAARGLNGQGVTGSCPNARLMLIRKGGSFMADTLAFDYARREGADIITCSWGYPIGTPSTRSLEAAISRAAVTGRAGRGCVVLFAMNNRNVNDCTSTAPDISSHPLVIGVSRATNFDRFDNSGFGNCMDVLGPTRNSNGSFGSLAITTTDVQGAIGVPGAYRNNFGGTSAATPITAGIAGLILSVDPTLSWLQVQWLLQDTTDKVEDSLGRYSTRTGFSTPPGGVATHGFGRVNAFEAVRVVAPTAAGGRGGVDIFLRDNRLDWGNTEQPSNVLFESTRGRIPHWQSVDIKIDAPPYEAAPPTTSAEFDAFPDENPIAETLNHVYVRVHNRGPVGATDVRVKLHWAFAGTALPRLPADFWTRFPSDSTDTSRWNPLGTQTIPVVGYSGTSLAGTTFDRAKIAAFDFNAPAIDPAAADPRHYCLFAVIDSAQDPVSPASRASLIPDVITPNDNNVTHRNVQLQDPAMGGAVERFLVRNPWPFDVISTLRVVAPDNWGIQLSPVTPGEAFLLGPEEEVLVDINIVRPPGQWETGGSVTIVQEAVGANFDPYMGGFTFEWPCLVPENTSANNITDDPWCAP